MKKFYLDELGQIYNILAGEMSVVGPRPLPVVSESNSFPPRRMLKTGIFCFPANQWKNEGDTFLKHSTDEQYLKLYRESSVWEMIKLDLWIMVDGFRAILKAKGK